MPRILTFTKKEIAISFLTAKLGDVENYLLLSSTTNDPCVSMGSPKLLVALQLYFPWSVLRTFVIVNTDLKGLFEIITLLSCDTFCESFLQVITGSGEPSTPHCNLTKSPAIAVVFKMMFLNFGRLLQVVGFSKS